jgi:sialic acid synthase SpsE|tara:strand:+ start:4254 stop:5087 length:834 start_codon:yes stop_codon:yes gene_type:complete
MKIISELCQNHNGDRSILESMIKAAAVDSDILKIQSIKADTLTKREEYEEFRPYEGEYKRLKGIELSWEDEKFFIDKCKEHGVESMTTLFTPNHTEYFNSLGYDNLKLSGYSIPAFGYGKLLKDINFKTLYFSASSLTLDEISKTVINLKEMNIDFYLLGCTCVYPTPLEKANLQNIDFYRFYFGLDRIGYSDHSNPHDDNLLTAKLAIFQGIDVLERHFTILEIDETRDGKVSMTPSMLAELKRFSMLSQKEQYIEINEFNKQQEHNHDYYRGRFA